MSVFRNLICVCPRCFSLCLCGGEKFYFFLCVTNIKFAVFWLFVPVALKISLFVTFLLLKLLFFVCFRHSASAVLLLPRCGGDKFSLFLSAFTVIFACVGCS